MREGKWVRILKSLWIQDYQVESLPKVEAPNGRGNWIFQENSR